jgi:PPOX class probable F420-dependent enzyme
MANLILTATELAFLDAARTATLATLAPDGRPRLVPICFVVGDDDRDGRPRLYSPLDEKPKRSADPRELARVRDLQARPAAALLVDRWSEDWTLLGWLRLDGRGELLEPGSGDRAEHATAVVDLRTKYPQYAGHRLGERPIIRLTIDRASSWGNLSVG